MKRMSVGMPVGRNGRVQTLKVEKTVICHGWCMDAIVGARKKKKKRDVLVGGGFGRRTMMGHGRDWEWQTLAGCRRLLSKVCTGCMSK